MARLDAEVEIERRMGKVRPEKVPEHMQLCEFETLERKTNSRHESERQMRDRLTLYFAFVVY